MTHTHIHTHTHTHMHLTFTTVWQYTAGIHEYDYIVTLIANPSYHKVTLLPTWYMYTFGQSQSQIYCSHMHY